MAEESKKKSKAPLIIGLGALGLFLWNKKAKDIEQKVKDNYIEPIVYDKTTGTYDLDKIEKQASGKFLSNMPNEISLNTDLPQIIFNPEASEKSDSIIPYVVPNSFEFRIVEHGNVIKANNVVSITKPNWSGTQLEAFREDKFLVCNFLMDFFVPPTLNKFNITKFNIGDIEMFYRNTKNNRILLKKPVTIEMFDTNNTLNEFWMGSENMTNYYYNKYFKNTGYELEAGHNIFFMHLIIPYRWKGYQDKNRQNKVSYNGGGRYYDQFDFNNPFVSLDEMSFRVDYSINNIQNTLKVFAFSDTDTTNNHFYRDRWAIEVRNKPTYSTITSNPIENRPELTEYLKSYFNFKVK